MKLGICSCQASGEKWHEICLENFQVFYELRFLRKEEQQNFTRNFTAFSMATSTRGFRTKFHGSTSASLAEMKSIAQYESIVACLLDQLCQAPSDIMNHLLSFFREVVVASVLRAGSLVAVVDHACRVAVQVRHHKGNR